jgi:predicted SAM-dependent methyltransferase
MRRVLRPGGLLLLSVPDIEIIARQLINESIPIHQRRILVSMMYGGQQDEYDFHYVGFTYDMLAEMLMSFDFCDVQRVGDFNIFRDTSTTIYQGRHVSLNILARPCVREDQLHVLEEYGLFQAVGVDEYDAETW